MAMTLTLIGVTHKKKDINDDDNKNDDIKRSIILRLQRGAIFITRTRSID